MAGGKSPTLHGRGGLEFNRRILLLEDCEGYFIWVASGTGGDDLHAYASSAAYFGGKGINLATRTTSAADGDNVAITRLLTWPEGSLLVVRGMMSFVDQSDCEFAGVTITECDGASKYQYGFRGGRTGLKWEYIDAAGNYVEVSSQVFQVTDKGWIRFELQVDLTKHEYVSSRWGGRHLDMDGIGYNLVGADTERLVRITLHVEAAGAASAQIFWDAIYVGERVEI